MLLQHTTLLFVGVKGILTPQICLAFISVYFPLLWFNVHLSLLTIFHSLFYLFTSLINRILLLAFLLSIYPIHYCLLLHCSTMKSFLLFLLWIKILTLFKLSVSLSLFCPPFLPMSRFLTPTPLLRLAFHNHRNR